MRGALIAGVLLWCLSGCKQRTTSSQVRAAGASQVSCDDLCLDDLLGRLQVSLMNLDSIGLSIASLSDFSTPVDAEQALAQAPDQPTGEVFALVGETDIAARLTAIEAQVAALACNGSNKSADMGAQIEALAATVAGMQQEIKDLQAAKQEYARPKASATEARILKTLQRLEGTLGNLRKSFDRLEAAANARPQQPSQYAPAYQAPQISPPAAPLTWADFFCKEVRYPTGHSVHCVARKKTAAVMATCESDRSVCQSIVNGIRNETFCKKHTYGAYFRADVKTGTLRQPADCTTDLKLCLSNLANEG
jgi:hypothetical protein